MKCFNDYDEWDDGVRYALRWHENGAYVVQAFASPEERTRFIEEKANDA